MSERLTRQGVRNLNPVGHNGHRKNKSPCKHWFTGSSIVIGTRWVYDPIYFDDVEVPVYGKKCAWCSEVRGEP